MQVGDRVRYTLRAENGRYGSVWTGVSIVDTLPQGLEIDLDSIYLVGPDGSTRPASAQSTRNRAHPEARAIGQAERRAPEKGGGRGTAPTRYPTPRKPGRLANLAQRSPEQRSQPARYFWFA